MLGDWVQKAMYLGVGLASYASEKASETLNDLPAKVQKLADEMVARGEMTTEEARRYVDEMLRQVSGPSDQSPSNAPGPDGPRQIEILEAEVDEAVSGQPSSGTSNAADTMRQQVQDLQDELQRLRDRSW